MTLRGSGNLAKTMNRNDIERFLALVGPLNDNECRLWTGCLRNAKYGQFYAAGERRGAHVVAFEIAFGPVPTGSNVLHKCDVPLCVNPPHLFLGSIAENNADRERKGRGRQPRGEKNGQAKLSYEKAAEIRWLIFGGKTHEECAQMFRVSKSAIGFVARYETWVQQ